MKRDIGLRGSSRRDFIKAVMSASAVLGLGPTRALEVLEKMGGSALAADAIDACYSVNLMAGSGGLAWFSGVWPCPPMINNFVAQRHAYDDKVNAVQRFNAEGRELWARKVTKPGGGKMALWENFGEKKLVTAMMCGVNNMHEDVPVAPGNSNTIVNGVSTGGVLSAFGGQAVLQQNIRSIVPVIGMNSTHGSKPAMPYQRFGNQGPQMASVGDYRGLIELFNAQASQYNYRLKLPENCSVFRLYYNAFLDLVRTRDQATYQRAYSDANVAVDLLCVNYGPLLYPSDGDTLAATWAGNPVPKVTTPEPDTTPLLNMAKSLIIVANAFRLGLCSQAIIPVLEDDPHFAFPGGIFTRNTDSIAQILQSFMDELYKQPLPGTTGTRLSDYVVLTVSGDLPKNSYSGGATSGGMKPGALTDWADATFAAANWIYVMSNGYLKPGWFGQYVHKDFAGTSGKVNFDPATGALDTQADGTMRIKATARAPGISDGTCTDAALAATLYAVSRGNKAKVGPFFDGAYEGLIKT